MALYQSTAKAILDHIHSVAAMAANSGSAKLRLFTTAPTVAGPGAGEVAAGGGYATGGVAVTWGAATNGANPPTATSTMTSGATYSNMPRAETVNAVDTTDSTATPVPRSFGTLTGGGKAVSAGDALSFSATAVTEAVTS